MIAIETEFANAEARLRGALRDPEAMQTQLLREILTINRDTEYGRRFDFGSIADLASYRARVPLVTYADVGPDVERMVAGEADVLFAGLPTFFGHTSGTTAAPKRIGFNPRVRAEYVHMLGPIVAMLERDHPGASRQMLLLTAQFDETRSPAGIPIGNGSGFVRRCLEDHPYFRFAPEAVYESRDPDARSYALLRLALARPMRCFGALFPVLLINLMRRATELVDALAHDLEHGTLVAGPAGIRALAAECVPRLRPMPEEARRLREIVRAHGQFVPAEYWPDVVVLHVWKGGTAKHALGELQSLFPRAEIRPMSSGSTEASLMVPFEGGWSGGVPALCSTVIEFLPADGGDVVTLRELEPDRGYRLVVTNHRGLYRYVMEDVFSIETHYEGVPVLRLDHRVGIVSSFAGEKVTEAQVSNAIDRAIEATGISPQAFQVAAEKLSGHAATFRYVVEVELDGDHTPDALRGFLAVVEQTLLATNTQYVLNRNVGALAPAALHRMVRGHFDALLRGRTAKGRNDIQFKLLALSTELLVRDDASVLELIVLDP